MLNDSMTHSSMAVTTHQITGLNNAKTIYSQIAYRNMSEVISIEKNWNITYNDNSMIITKNIELDTDTFINDMILLIIDEYGISELAIQTDILKLIYHQNGYIAKTLILNSEELVELIL